MRQQQLNNWLQSILKIKKISRNYHDVDVKFVTTKFLNKSKPSENQDDYLKKKYKNPFKNSVNKMFEKSPLQNIVNACYMMFGS